MLVDEHHAGHEMSWTRYILPAAILGLALLAAPPADARDDETAERLSKLWGMTFVPGRLTEIVTPSPPTVLELSHGFELLTDLAPENCPPNCSADADQYQVSAKPFSSYEAVVDATSGDIGPTLAVDRVVAGTTTVLQTSQAVGVGFTRSIRWRNTTASPIDTEAIRVTSGQCTTDCGPDDVYFIRGYETTYSIPRFNNSGTQVTVLLLQNPTNYTITGDIYFWAGDGTLVATQPFTLGAKNLQVLNTATVAPGIGGAVTIAHDGRYGDLSAKTVALEPATGFSFDSPALPRIR
jgi:hypothetical protein